MNFLRELVPQGGGRKVRLVELFREYARVKIDILDRVRMGGEKRLRMAGFRVTSISIGPASTSQSKFLKK